MDIDRGDRDERQTRVESMISEFEGARRRRLVKSGERATDSHMETEAKAAVTKPAPRARRVFDGGRLQNTRSRDRWTRG